MKKIIRNKEGSIQEYRGWIQLLFVGICVWIGIEFYLFVEWLETNGHSAFQSRPPGAEAFLPISSLMSFYYFAQTGEIHEAHPAGLFILFAVVIVSFVFGKSFCSWICPIGTLSEYIGEAGEKLQKKLFGKVYRLPRPVDYILRSLKYLLLGFFVYSIFFLMTSFALKAFLDSPYNITADIKMYYFFANISETALIVIAVLFLLSVVIRNFWCRYLCPYGALLGIFSLFSPNKIKRNLDSCIDCGLCSKACPARIKVDKSNKVFSDECSTCLNCVDVCPVNNTLELRNGISGRKNNKKRVAIGIVGIFVAVLVIGMLTDNWDNKISKEEYREYYKNIEAYGHPRSTRDIEKLNQQSETGEAYGDNSQLQKTKAEKAAP